MRSSYILRAMLMAVAATAVVYGTACYAADPKLVAGRVNGIVILQEDFDLLLKDRMLEGQADTPALRKQLHDELAIHELVSQEAMKKGLDKQAETLVRIRLARLNILFESYLQDFLAANPISDKAAKAEYDSTRAKQGETEYRIRHILLDSEAIAKYLISQLKKGESFVKLATDLSVDEASRDKGGELEWTPISNFPPAFGEAIGKIKKGQFSQEPVHTEFGWHIIKIEDERPIVYPPFEEIKDKVKQSMQQKMFDQQLANLKSGAKIE